MEIPCNGDPGAAKVLWLLFTTKSIAQYNIKGASIGNPGCYKASSPPVFGT